MNNFAYPTGFPNGTSFSGSYENVQNYQTIIIDYHTNSTDILTVHYSNDTISDYYTTNYTISNQQLQFVLNPSYTFFKLTAEGTGTAARYCKCRYYTEISGNSSNTTVNTILEGTNANNIVGPINMSSQNNLCVEINGSNSAFGDILTTSMTQVFSNTFIYGFVNRDLNTLVNQTDATSIVTNNILTCYTSADNKSVSLVRSRQYVKYSPGIGVAARFTAIFNPPDNNKSIIGLGTPECGLYFGMYGTNNFSAILITNAMRQIVTFQVITKSLNTYTLTVTLGGVQYNVAMAADASVEATAYTIANFDYSTKYPGWIATATGDTVTFVSIESGQKSTDNTISAGDVTGTFTVLVTGTTGTTNVYMQTNWNVDTMNGYGPSGMTLDPTKGNVYWIKYQYLGFGQITFGVEDNNTGKLIPVHVIKYTNTSTTVSLSNPSMPFMMASINLGTYPNSIKCASYAAFIEGNPGLPAIMHDFQYSASPVAGTAPIFSLRNKIVFNGRVNQSTVSPLSINVCNNTAASIIIYVTENCVLNNSAVFSPIATSIVETDTTATTSTGIQRLSICIAAGTAQMVSLTDYNIIFEPGSILTISGKTAGGDSIDIAIQWAENQ